MTTAQPLQAVLDQRGNQYGDFRHQAVLAQTLKNVVREHLETQGVEVEPFQMESLDMILHKVARICNGNPNNVDSWQDIAGYATIAMIRSPEWIPEPETPVVKKRRA